MAFKISEMMKITILNFPSKHTPTFPTNNHHVYFHDVSDEVKDYLKDVPWLSQFLCRVGKKKEQNPDATLLYV